MNAKCKKPLLLFFFLSMSICGIAQITIEKSKLTAEQIQIIEKYFKYEITNNYYTIIEIDTLSIRNIVKEEIKPVKDAFDEFIREQKLIRDKQLSQKDSIYNDSIMRLNERIQISENALDLVKKRQKELEAKKWSYLPFGAHQFATKQTGKGIFFLGAEVSLLVSGSILAYKTNKTYNTYLNEPYQSVVRNNHLKTRYSWQLAGTIICFAGAAAIIGWNYCDNFKSKQNKNVVFVPAAGFDQQGNLQMGMNLSIKF